jgi:opacity protein-like surface antigen
MKRFVLLVATLSASLLFASAQQNTTLSERLRAHVEYLASEELGGRGAGSSQGYLAGDYIKEQFASFGLRTFERADYFHPFATTWNDGVFRNVVGRISGVDNDSYIIIGAHYDHIGMSGGKIHPGADDNASGTAALIEIARTFSEMNIRPQHTIIFAAFDAEELGLYGSADLAARFPKGSVKVMINMDMVGWLKDGSLKVEGVGTLDDVERIIYSAGERHKIDITTKRFETGFLTATATEPFAKNGVPTLSFNTGMESPYHRPEDTADKIDYEGLALITRTVGEIAVRIDASEKVEASGRIARKHRSGSDGMFLGLHGSFGSNHFKYPETAFVGREADAWSAGLSLLYTYKHFGVRVGATYNSRKALIPTDTTNPYSPSQELSMSTLTVPMDLMLKTNGLTSLYITAGSYYTLNLSASLAGAEYLPRELSLRQEEWGLQWGLGVRVGSFFLESTNRYGLTPAYTEGPTIYNRGSYVTLGLYF